MKAWKERVMTLISERHKLALQKGPEKKENKIWVWGLLQMTLWESLLTVPFSNLRTESQLDADISAA